MKYRRNGIFLPILGFKKTVASVSDALSFSLWLCLLSHQLPCHEDIQKAHEEAQKARNWGLPATVCMNLEADLRPTNSSMNELTSKPSTPTPTEPWKNTTATPTASQPYERFWTTDIYLCYSQILDPLKVGNNKYL